MKKYGFGVDIGGTSIKMGLFETSGKLLDKWEITTRKEKKGQFILPDVADSIEAKMAEKGISGEEVQGIGIGVPGPVNSEGVVNGCVNLGWDVVDVKTQMSAVTGFPVQVGNDANVAALGEMWQGGAKGSRDVVMVTLGTGVGGGIIVNGKIVAGFHGAGGEIGHMTVDKQEPDSCNCGRKGCLEQYASATGIVRMAKRKLAVTETATCLSNIPELTAKDIFDAAKAKDAVAMELVEELGRILGMALSNIACVVNPETIVIGGGVSKAGSILTDTVQKYFAEAAFPACKATRFALAGLGNDAGIYGCMQMILE